MMAPKDKSLADIKLPGSLCRSWDHCRYCSWKHHQQNQRELPSIQDDKVIIEEFPNDVIYSTVFL